MITTGNVLQLLNKKAPLELAEPYDNVGLLLGSYNLTVRGILTTLEVTHEIIDKAVLNDCNLIVSHHPLIFKPLKNITPDQEKSALLMRLIQHNMSLIAMHTNWDRTSGGTSFYMCEKLGLTNLAVLQPESGRLSVIHFTVPSDSVDLIKQEIFKKVTPISTHYTNGLLYHSVSEEYASRKNNHATDLPSIEVHKENNIRCSIIIKNEDVELTLSSIRQIHSYEEWWYEVVPLKNYHQNTGYGCIGEYEMPLAWEEFVQKIKDIFKCKYIRHSCLGTMTVKRVAFCGGSGSFLYPSACREKADVLLTADVKYHDFEEAVPDTILVDIGHYESEHLLSEQFKEVLMHELPSNIKIFSFNRINPIFINS